MATKVIKATTKEKKKKKAVGAKASSKKTAKDTSAFALKSKDGKAAVVGMMNLHVVITRDAGQWFAQGLEIDYAAQGKSEKDARTQFEEGLCSTIHAHLSHFGNIKKLLRVAPQNVWKEMLFDRVAVLKNFSQISFHREFTKELRKESESFPFRGIQYLEPEPELACA